MASSFRDYLSREKLADLICLLQEYRWYVAGTAVTGALLLKLVTRPRNLPAGPRGWPMLGSLGELSEDTHKDCDRLSKIYGDVFSINILGKLVVVLNSHEAIREAMIKHSEEFAHRWESGVATALQLRDEIISKPYNETWKQNKKIALVTLRSYGFGTTAGESRILDQVDNIAKYLTKNGVNPVDPEEFCRKAASNMLLGVMFGTNYDFEDEDFVHLTQLQKAWSDLFYDSRMTALEVIPSWLARIVLRKYLSQLIIATKAYKQLLIQYVLDHVRHFDPFNLRDTVDGYLKERGPQNVDPDVIASNVMTFTADATVTMASAIRAAIFYLAKYPDVQTDVQQQLDAVVGASRKVLMKDRSSLPLVDAVIHETLRILTPASITAPRVVHRNVTISGYCVPKGSVVVGSIWGVHMSPDNYEDPCHFRVGHFLEEDGSLKKVADAWMPFELGRRKCLGEQLTKMEMYLILSNILLKYRITFPEDFLPPEDDDVINKGFVRELKYFLVLFNER